MSGAKPATKWSTNATLVVALIAAVGSVAGSWYSSRATNRATRDAIEAQLRVTEINNKGIQERDREQRYVDTAKSFFKALDLFQFSPTEPGLRDVLEQGAQMRVVTNRAEAQCVDAILRLVRALGPEGPVPSVTSAQIDKLQDSMTADANGSPPCT